MTRGCPLPPQLFDLERQRQERVGQLATLIQKMFRGWRCRTQFQLMRKSQIIISAWFRGHWVRTGWVLAALPLPIPRPPALRAHPAHPLLSPAAKEPVQADEAVGADPAGVRTGLEGEGGLGHPRDHQRDWPGVGSGEGGDRGSVCPSVGPGAPVPPVVGPDSPSPPLPVFPPPLLPLSCLSLSLRVCVGVSPLGLPGLSPPQSRRLLRELKRQRRRQAAATTIAAHWRGYQVTGPPPSGHLCPAVRAAVSGLSVCPPTLSGWSRCPLRRGQMWGMWGTGHPCPRWGWWRCPVSSPLAPSPQARRTYRRYFRSSASTCVANFIYRSLVSGAGERGQVTTVPSQPPALGLDSAVPS